MLVCKFLIRIDCFFLRWRGKNTILVLIVGYYRHLNGAFANDLIDCPLWWAVEPTTHIHSPLPDWRGVPITPLLFPRWQQNAWVLLRQHLPLDSANRYAVIQNTVGLSLKLLLETWALAFTKVETSAPEDAQVVLQDHSNEGWQHQQPWYTLGLGVNPRY